EEKVGMTIVVMIPNGHSVAVTLREIRDAGGGGGILVSAVPPVAEEAVAGARGLRVGGERSALDAVDIEPAVAVVVEKADAPAHGLRNLPRGGRAVVEAETEAGGLGVIREGRRGREAPERVGGRGGDWD